MNEVPDVIKGGCVGLVIGFVAATCIGVEVTISNVNEEAKAIQADAVKAGVGEYVISDFATGKTTFHWKTAKK